MASQLLAGLAGAGHRVRAIAQITPELDAAGDVAAPPGVDVERYRVPYFDTSPDVDRPGDYREVERQGIEGLALPAIRRETPDLIISGRIVAWHVSSLAVRHGLPACGACTGGNHDRFAARDVRVEPGTNLARSYPAGRCSHRRRELPRPPPPEAGHPGGGGGPEPGRPPALHAPPARSQLADALDIRETDIVVAHLSNMKRLKRPLDLVHWRSTHSGSTPRCSTSSSATGRLRAETQEAATARGLAPTIPLRRLGRARGGTLLPQPGRPGRYAVGGRSAGSRLSRDAGGAVGRCSQATCLPPVRS